MLCYCQIQAIIDTTSVYPCQPVSFDWRRKVYKLNVEPLEGLQGQVALLFTEPSRTDRFVHNVCDLVVPAGEHQ